MLSGRATEEEARSWRLTGPDVTEVVLVLDKSGSMHKLLNATLDAFNDFIREQQAEPGKAAFTLTLFNHEYDLVLNGVDIQAVGALDRSTYRPGGETALFDAVGRTVYEVKERLLGLPEDRRPKRVIFVTLTDGQENKSQEYTAGQVKAQIAECTAQGWKFVFLGANQDSWLTARSMGIPVAGAANFVASSIGTHAVFAAAAGMTSSLRRAPDPDQWQPDLTGSSGSENDP
jgi:Mg-chelatase subunit ChlD